AIRRGDRQRKLIWSTTPSRAGAVYHASQRRFFGMLRDRLIPIINGLKQRRATGIALWGEVLDDTIKRIILMLDSCQDLCAYAREQGDEVWIITKIRPEHQHIHEISDNVLGARTVAA